MSVNVLEERPLVNCYHFQGNFLIVHASSPAATSSTCSNNVSSINTNYSCQPYCEHSADILSDNLQTSFQEVFIFLNWFDKIMCFIVCLFPYKMINVFKMPSKLHWHSVCVILEHETQQGDNTAAWRKHRFTWTNYWCRNGLRHSRRFVSQVYNGMYIINWAALIEKQ